MECAALHAALEKHLELSPGSITGDELLADLPGWDSMAVVGFIAMVDEKFGVILPASRLIECKTTNDLIQLVKNT